MISPVLGLEEEEGRRGVGWVLVYCENARDVGGGGGRPVGRKGKTLKRKGGGKGVGAQKQKPSVRGAFHNICKYASSLTKEKASVL